MVIFQNAEILGNVHVVLSIVLSVPLDSPQTLAGDAVASSEANFWLKKMQRPPFAALSVALGAAHSAARSVGKAYNKTTTARRTFDGHIEVTVALLDGVRCLWCVHRLVEAQNVV